MQLITHEQACDILATSCITTTQNLAGSTINVGVTQAGVDFILITDQFGESAITLRNFTQQITQ